MEFVSRCQQTLSAFAAITPVPSHEIFKVATDKWLLTNFLAQNQVLGPPTILYTADQNFYKRLHELSFPVLTKPVRGHGGKGIKRFDNPAAVLNFLKNVTKERTLQYIVQNYIHGYDVDCSVLCYEGKVLAYTIQRAVIGRSKRYAAPAGIEFIKDDQVLDIVNRLIAALNWNGIAHIDLRYDSQDGQIKVIEVNARYWGSLTASLIVGVNFPYLSCLAALDLTFPIPDYRHDYFIEYKTAMQEKLLKLLGKNNIHVKFKNTDLGYLVADPFAEIFNLYRRMRT